MMILLLRLLILTMLVATAGNNHTTTPVAATANGHTVYAHLQSSTPIMIIIRSEMILPVTTVYDPSYPTLCPIISN